MFDTTVEQQISRITKQLVELNNLKHKIERLRLEGEELVKYGPALSPEDQEEDEVATDSAQTSEQPVESIDPTGRRSGQGDCALRRG